MNLKIPIKKDLAIKIIIVLFISLMCILIFTKILNDTDQEKIASKQKQELFDMIDKKNNVNITKYTVYGTHFNIEGTIDILKISGIKINYVDLIVKKLTGEEITVKSNFNYTDNTLTFSTSDKINEGLDLESLDIADYYLLLKLTYSNSDILYYSFVNGSEYGDIKYYTITKNNSNNEIDISFNKYNEVPYMCLNVKKAGKLPDDVYDIAIDAGHGGGDIGAKSGEYTESDLVLNCSKLLKSKLEEQGLKVFMSRDGSESTKVNLEDKMFDGDGKINILQESHAKLIISLHINENKSSKGGVEVYAPNGCNLDFAESLAKNIVEKANTNYSSATGFKKADGVYVRTFNNADILALKTRAIKNKYEPYNVTTSTTFTSIIRETGGIATCAYVDGRNTSYGKNKYYNSNVGIECYLIQLGYMSCKEDVNNIANNMQSYVDGIFESIKTNYL